MMHALLVCLCKRKGLRLAMILGGITGDEKSCKGNKDDAVYIVVVKSLKCKQMQSRPERRPKPLNILQDPHFTRD